MVFLPGFDDLPHGFPVRVIERYEQITNEGGRKQLDYRDC